MNAIRVAVVPLLLATVCAQAPPPVRVQHNAGLEQGANGTLFGGGADYDVGFDRGGMRFEPALGRAAATTEHLALRPVSITRGGEPLALAAGVAPRRAERTATYERSTSVRERYRCLPEGVELSWQFDRRPAGSGDLVVRYELTTSLPDVLATGSGGLSLGRRGVGGVTIGGVLGIDAAGRRVDGSLRYEAGSLTMSLPACFVDTASYPMVLDPLIGAAFTIWGGAQYQDANPDIVFESSEGRYVAVFQRTFAAADIRIRAQLVHPTSGLFQGVIWIAGQIGQPVVTTRPRIASFSRMSEAAVVWSEDIGTQTIAFCRRLSTVDGSLSPASSIGQSSAGTLVDLDIGSEQGSHQGTEAYVAVWDDTNDDRIYARPIHVDQASGGITLQPAFAVFTDSLFVGYSEPAISRATAAGGKLLVVARRFSGIGSSAESVVARMVAATGGTFGTQTTIGSGSGIEFATPDVDGYGSQWVIAWRENNVGSSYQRVVTRSARLLGTTLELSAPVAIGGTALAQAREPTVGYSFGKTWLGYRYSSFGSTYLTARGIGSGDCVSCQDTHANPIATADSRIVVATTMSGNTSYSDECMIAWEHGSDIWVQLATNHGGGGSRVDLGGGCGAGGQHTSGLATTGRNRFSCSVVQLTPNAPLTVFNFVAGGSQVAGCGACAWLPFAATVPMPVTQWGNASIAFAIPCDPGLVGLQFETQWTTVDPSSAPCALLPGIAVSNRLQHTVGN